ncbi:MAG: phosphate ABC transporter ATP-binding protein [Elusimicrobia bacterium]|nr:phosphate ABC transporter ATP-binding protein [Elusimicrobiota bacterium]
MEHHPETPKLKIEGLNVWIGTTPVLTSVTFDVPEHTILSLIGPARSGKTTLLRALNRLNELNVAFRTAGQVYLSGQPVYGNGMDVASLRRRLGMVFSTPTPLPMSVWDNLTLGPRLKAVQSRTELERLVESSLKAAFLWDEVKDRLRESALKLSGGQQQRLCLARTLMLEPEVLLLDEPCSGLDPISTAKIEEALQELKRILTVVLVTNNVKQAARASDLTGFLLMGELVELNDTEELFTTPQDPRTADYVSGRFG